MKKLLSFVVLLLMSSCVLDNTLEVNELPVSLKSGSAKIDSVMFGITTKEPYVEYKISTIQYMDSIINVNQNIKSDTLWYGPFLWKSDWVNVSYRTYHNGYEVGSADNEAYRIESKKQFIYLMPHATEITFSPIVDDWKDDEVCNLK